MYILLGIFMVLFLIITYCVMTSKTEHIDDIAGDFCIQSRQRYLTKTLRMFTELGKGKYVAIFIIILFILPEVPRVLTLRVTVASVLSGIVVNILKRTVKRERPNKDRLVEEHDYSYPSAHACTAMAFYGTLMLNTYLFAYNYYIFIGIVGIIAIVMIGTSRIYLGIHHFCDVIGGYTLGIIFIIISSLLV